LGTDNLGRDILKRTLYATPLTLQLAVSAAGMAIVIGFTAGPVTAYLPGRLRNSGVRSIEVMLAFPGILIASMLVAVVWTSAQGAVLAIGIAFSPSLARVAFTLASGVAGLDYISSARVLDLSSRRIVFPTHNPKYRRDLDHRLLLRDSSRFGRCIVAKFPRSRRSRLVIRLGSPDHRRRVVSESSTVVGFGAGDCHRHYRFGPRSFG